MLTCPNCGKKTNSLKCPSCGFDEGMNYERYPVLTPLDDRYSAVYRKMLFRPEASFEKAVAGWKMGWRRRPVELLTRAADAGHLASMTVLASLFERGIPLGEETLAGGEGREKPFSLEKDLFRALFYYRKAAETGYAPALLRLGVSAFYGDSLQAEGGRDEEAAFRYFSQGAEKDLPACVYWKGICLYEGKGTKKDRKAAYACFERCSALNSAAGDWMRAICLAEGNGTGKQPEEAQRLLERWRFDSAPHAFYLGKLLYDQKKEKEKAMACLKDAADRGVKEANLWMGLLYEEKKETDKALACYLAAGDEIREENWARDGEVEAGLHPFAFRIPVPGLWYTPPVSIVAGWRDDRIGICYFNRKEYEKAFPCFLAAAKAGNVNAMSWAGYCCRNGFGLPEKDFSQAKKWYRNAAEKGDEYSRKELQKLLAEDTSREGVAEYLTEKEKSSGLIADEKYRLAAAILGLPEKGEAAGSPLAGKEIAGALMLLKQAAEENHVRAAYWMGRLSYDGVYLERDTKAAALYWKKAAGYGEPRANAAMGRGIRAGIPGFPKEVKEALPYEIRAFQGGYWKTRKEIPEEVRLDFGRDCLKKGQGEGALSWLSEKDYPALSTEEQALYGYCLYLDAREKEGEESIRQGISAASCLSGPAGKGSLLAQYAMGKIRLHGLDGTKDRKEGISWMRQALQNYQRQGEPKLPYFDPAAVWYEMGEMILRDAGSKEETEEGLHALEEAASHGSVQGRLDLARCYQEGKVISRDYKKAEAILKEGASWPGDSMRDIRMRIESEKALKELEKIPAWKKMLGL